MNSLTLQSPVVVITDGEQSLIITDMLPDSIKDDRIPSIEKSLVIRSAFKLKGDKPLLCHFFPSARIISHDLLLENDRLVDQAIQFKPD